MYSNVSSSCEYVNVNVNVNAQDFVEAMWLMLQPDTPRDYVVSTGVQHSVRQFVEAAFRAVGITLECAAPRRAAWPSR